VLVTSRNPAWSGIAATIGVEVLDRSEAVTFLVQRLGSTDATLERLAAALGDLPLALEQAAAFIDETGTSPAEYLELLRQRAPELFRLGRPSHSEQTIASTWTAALQRLHDQAPAAEDLLRLCAFLAPDDLPLSLLHNHPDQLPEPLAATVGDPLGLQQTLEVLRRYSLLAATGDSVSVHRLVQAVTRHQLNPQQRQQWTAAALALLWTAVPEQPDDPDAWPVMARLLPHVLAVSGHATSGRVEPVTTVRLLTETARYLLRRAELQQATRLLERALAIREGRLGPDHPDTAQSLNNLAVVLLAQGDLDRARSLHQRALVIREARLGADHPDTARSREDLAAVLAALENRH
jgi:tetratricopeptide (TPR) repeat protein